MIAAHLKNAMRQIGVSVRDLAFRIVCADGRQWTPPDFDWRVENDKYHTLLHGAAAGIAVQWSFIVEAHGCWVALSVEADQPLPCTALESLILTYTPDADDLGEWWVTNSGATIHSVGLHRVRELDEQTRTDHMLRGVFRDSRAPGLLLGTRIPQAQLHDYTLVHDDATLRLTATTHFAAGSAPRSTLRSEATWICTTLPVRDALAVYATHIPPLARTAPVVGWNSWDYYFFSVSLDDLIENMDAIRCDPVLSQHVQYVVIDAGWEHRNGEWEPNYKFPGGLARAAAEIRARGFIPGIWTAPVLIDQFSYAGMRQPELLITNAYGDPQPADVSGHYLLDPTHPAGEQFITQLYTRLYDAGFRLFKIDYVDVLARTHRFHDTDAGPYDALRQLFGTIRRCVTDASHILGCSLPAACGAGVADSGRFGIDIHNHWSHVEWVCDYLQLSFWQHGRIWANDPDFLVVRGPATSLERSTNVTNPHANNPQPPRWRRGPDFTLAEAQTWASVVALAGGNIVLSDRISQLNDVGRRLLANVIEPTNVAAQPLDLCDDRRASLWLQTLPRAQRLTVINWHDHAVERVISLDRLVRDVPTSVVDVWHERHVPVQHGQLLLRLEPHASAVLSWDHA